MKQCTMYPVRKLPYIDTQCVHLETQSVNTIYLDIYGSFVTV